MEPASQSASKGPRIWEDGSNSCHNYVEQPFDQLDGNKKLSLSFNPLFSPPEAYSKVDSRSSPSLNTTVVPEDLDAMMARTMAPIVDV